MPVLKNRVAFEVARGIKAFLNLEVGLTRGEAPGVGTGTSGTGATAARVRKIGHRLTSRGRALAGSVGATPASSAQSDPQPRDARDRCVRAENLVWIFGSGRSGSTWLRSMMSEMT
ncbi:MAG: hypothetical protein ACR2JR_14500, partial [Rubrobacteraceae bacterium]